MMNTSRVKYRVMSTVIVLCMLGNSQAAYAMGGSDGVVGKTVMEEKVTSTMEESSVEIIATSEEESVAIDEETTATIGENTTVTEETAETTYETTTENPITTVEETTTEEEENTNETEIFTEEDSLTETEECVVEPKAENSECAISTTISEITGKSAIYTVNISGLQEGETAYLQIQYTCDKENTRYLRTADIDAETTVSSHKLQNLYADTEYTISAVLYTDNTCTTELTKTAGETFHTQKNTGNLKLDVAFSDITNNSAILTLSPSDEVLANLQELNVSRVAVTVKYRCNSRNEWSEYMSMLKSDNYTNSLTLTNLYADTTYTIDILWGAIGDNGQEITTHTFTTQKADMEYSFIVEGDTLASGFTNFSLTSGYEEGKEYQLDVYVSEDGGYPNLFERVSLTGENGYSYQGTRVIYKKWDVEYTIWAEVVDASDSTRLIMTDIKNRKIEKTKVFDLSVKEDSITYITAKFDVNWVNTDAIAAEEIEIYLYGEYNISDYITLNKNSKKKCTIGLYRLIPGRTYTLTLAAQINGAWYDFESISFSTQAYEFEKFTEVKQPSQMDIARKWKELGIDLQQADTYDREVNHTDGGILSKETLQNAVDLTNFYRYVAGLPADLIYDEEWCGICNSGSEINRLNNELSHYPSKPSGVSEEFYQRGCLGTSSSNLAAGSSNLAASIQLYMYDPGESNISKGHRTWILQPALSTLGFGKSGSYYSMYVFSASGFEMAREVDFSKGYYYWPAHNTPMELYTTTSQSYHPSLYLSGEYDQMQAENITVHVKSKKLEKEWTYTGNSGTYESNEFLRVYDRKLVFATGLYPKGDEVTVTVTGTTINGADAPITYTMNFFSLKDVEVEEVAVEGIIISGNSPELMEGESVQLTAQILPENATNKQVKWNVESVDGNGEATITTDGLLTGVLEGEVKVTATSKADNTITDSVVIRITEKRIPLETITFAKNTLRLEKGDSYCLPAILTPYNTTDNNVVYSSDDGKKVEVSDGIIRALEITDSPVSVRATVGEKYAECLVEVYETTEEHPDKNYDTRITGVVMTGDSDILLNKKELVKFYPVTNGQELTADEFEMIVTCKGKYLTMEKVPAEDNGQWYQVSGVNKGSEKITVKVTSKVKGSTNPETVTKSFTFKVSENKEEVDSEISSAPVLPYKSISVNQNTTDGTALDIRLIEGNTNIRNIYLTSKKADGTEKLFVINKKEDTYYIQTKEIGVNKRYNLILHIETDLGNWEYPLSVATKKSFPKVTIKQTQKPNINLLYEKAIIKIAGKEDIVKIDFATTSTDFEKETITGSGAEYLLMIKQLEHGNKIDKTGNISIWFAGYRTPFQKKITIGTTSKKVKKDTLVSDIKKVTLNNTVIAQSSGIVQLSLKNSEAAYPEKVYVAGANTKSEKLLQNKKLSFTYNKNNGRLQVNIKEGADQGSYKFTFTGYIKKDGNYTPTEGKIAITVTISGKQPTLKFKASGTIDLINRSNSCVTYTPVIKEIARSIATVELTGESAGKFYARVTKEGKVQIYARSLATLIPKETYNIGIKATLSSGYGFDTIQVKIKPKQSNFKVVAKEKTITLCRNEAKPYPIEMVVKSPTTANIAYIKPVSLPQGITYDSVNKTLKITDSTKVKAKKTYNVVFEVTPTGAYKSIKPAKVTIKVKVQ